MTADGETTHYRYDKANRLLETGADSFIYDANGNMAEKTTEAGTRDIRIHRR